MHNHPLKVNKRKKTKYAEDSLTLFLGFSFVARTDKIALCIQNPSDSTPVNAGNPNLYTKKDI